MQPFQISNPWLQACKLEPLGRTPGLGAHKTQDPELLDLRSYRSAQKLCAKAANLCVAHGIAMFRAFHKSLQARIGKLKCSVWVFNEVQMSGRDLGNLPRLVHISHLKSWSLLKFYATECVKMPSNNVEHSQISKAQWLSGLAHAGFTAWADCKRLWAQTLDDDAYRHNVLPGLPGLQCGALHVLCSALCAPWIDPVQFNCHCWLSCSRLCILFGIAQFKSQMPGCPSGGPMAGMLSTGGLGL